MTEWETDPERSGLILGSALRSAKLTRRRFEPHATVSYRDPALAIEIPRYRIGVAWLLDLVVYRKLPSEIILELGKASKPIAVTCLLCLRLPALPTLITTLAY